MRAVQLVAWEQPAEVREVPKPVPGPGEVLLRVRAAGPLPLGPAPHALAGGDGALRAAVHARPRGRRDGRGAGRRARTASTSASPCSSTARGAAGAARTAAVGEEHLCERRDLRRGRRAASGATAGWRSTSSLPSPAAGACRSASSTRCARRRWPMPALTPYHAVKRALRDLRPGSTAVVIGVGGLGHVAVQLLRALSGCRIVAIDRRQEALDVALAAGADVAAAGRRADGARTSAAPRGGRAALVIDCVGVDATLALAAACCRAGRARRGHRRGRRHAAVPLRRGPVRDHRGVLELGHARRARRGRRARARGRACTSRSSASRSTRCPPPTSGSRRATSAAAWSRFPERRR